MRRNWLRTLREFDPLMRGRWVARNHPEGGTPDGPGGSGAAPAAAPAPSPSPAPSQPLEGTPYNPPEPAAPSTPGSGTVPGSTPTQPAATPTPAPAQTPAAPGATPTPGAPVQPQSWASARAYAQHLGLSGVERFQDDASFLQNVFAGSQQAEVYRQQLQQLAQQNAALLAASQRQAQPQQPAQPQQQPAKWWNPPEWNPAWEGLITRDDKGNLQVVPGADPTILSRYMAYQQYRKDFTDRLTRDPAAALGPMIQEEATRIAQAQVQQHMGQYQDSVQANQFVQQNHAWLFQRDALGQVLKDGMGNQVLSPAGQRFKAYVEQAHQYGVRGVQAQQEYATRALRHDILLAQFQQSQQAAASRQTVAGANRNPPASGTVPPVTLPGQPAAQPAQNPGLSLREQLAQAMATQGITDGTIAADGRV